MFFDVICLHWKSAGNSNLNVENRVKFTCRNFLTLTKPKSSNIKHIWCANGTKPVLSAILWANIGRTKPSSAFLTLTFDTSAEMSNIFVGENWPKSCHCSESSQKFLNYELKGDLRTLGTSANKSHMEFWTWACPRAGALHKITLLKTEHRKLFKSGVTQHMHTVELFANLEHGLESHLLHCLCIIPSSQRYRLQKVPNADIQRR